MSFSAREIFEIAIQIERNGQFFYTRAAEYAPNEQVRKLLADLAEMEADHERFFQEAADGLSAEERAGSMLDEDEHNLPFIRAIADGHVFDTSLDPRVLITGEEAPDEVLTTAVSLEKESIVYYSALREIVAGERILQRVNEIIREELSHVALLNGMKEQLTL